MARSSNVQGNFLGGEISPLAQGRVDDPQLAIALNYARNHIVTEEGALIRRPGTMRIAPTYGRKKPKYLKFISAAACPFGLEMTPDAMRILDGAGFVFTNDARTVSTSSLTAGIITLGLDTTHGWSVGDQFMINLTGTTDEGGCRGRVLTATTGTTGSTLKLGDDLSGMLPITGFVTNTSLVGATVYRIKRFTTTYSASDIPNLRVIQATLNAIILASDVAPQALSVDEPAAATEATFTFGALSFIDGPYLDNQTQSLSLSALTGSVTATAGSAVFAATDVGRLIRMFSQPPAWNSGSTYTAGQTVSYPAETNGPSAWWQAIIGSTGVVPGTPTVVAGVQQLAWAPAPTAGSWAWGKITAYTSTTAVTVAIDSSIPNMVLQSANGTTMSAWQLGVYSGTTGYPTCGAYFEGRIYLMGSVPNRFDASQPNGLDALAVTVTFSPTDPYGNVTDDNAISEVLNSKTVNLITWAEPDTQGLLCGTGSGEWLISASTQGDPITPTTIQAHQVTSYRSENIEPIRTPMALVFPQNYARRVIEYLADAFSQRFTGKPLNEKARHMTVAGIARVDYQDEPVPIVWALTNGGTLLGCTYRRVSRFVTENPVFNAWTQHQHGGGSVTDVCVVPATSGMSDRVYLAVQDAGGYFIELLQPMQEINPLASVRDGWFVDSSPGSTINPVGKCGFLYPSGGYSVNAAFFPADWSDVSAMREYPTVVSGDMASSSSAFLALNEGCYLNGYSALTSFGGAHNITGNYTVSVWLYVVGRTGALLSTNMALSGFQWEQGQIIGQDGWIWALAKDGTPQSYSDTDIGGTGGASAAGWINLLICGSATSGGLSSGQTTAVYANDTYIGGELSAMSFKDSGLGNITISTASLVVGGCSQTAVGDPSTPLMESNFFGQQIPSDGYGMTAGIAELWISFGHCIDFTASAANRALFHATDLTGLKYAPVKLGKHGELPLGGTRPTAYCSGNPTDFRVNRANGLFVTTFNYGGNGEIVEGVDPAAVKLDPLPAFIEPVT